MKSRTLILTLSLLFLSLGLMAGNKPLPADKVMSRAFKEAARKDKKVFLMFHASWCGWCHRMDSLMMHPDTRAFFDKHFVVTHLVVKESAKNKHLENPGSSEMLALYEGELQGIPYWLIFSAKGELLTDSRMETKNKEGKAVLANTGCPATQEEVDHFLKVLAKTTHMTEQDSAAITQLFLIKR